MKLFENGVGRPSNEIKKKRRTFVVATVVSVIAVVATIGVVLTGANINTRKLKGALDSSINGIKKVGNGYRNAYIKDNKLIVGYYPMGDANLSGTIDGSDSSQTLRYSAKLITTTDLQKKLMDVDGDGKVLAKDARKIYRYSEGLDSYIFTKKKYCLVDENHSESDCNWNKITYNGTITFPLVKKMYYTLFEYDVDTKKSSGLAFFQATGSTVEVEKSSISMPKFTDNWRVGTSGIVNVESSHDIKSVTSSNKNAMVILPYRTDDKKHKSYKLMSVGNGKATITATNSKGKSVSYTYSNVYDGLSPDKLFGKGKYTYQKINDRYKDGTYVKLYIDKSAPKTCVNAYRNGIDAITNSGRFAYSGTFRKAVDTVYIISESNWAKAGVPQAIGFAHSFAGQVALRCYNDFKKNSNATAESYSVVYHEFAHVVDAKFFLQTGKMLSDKYTPITFIQKKKNSNPPVLHKEVYDSPVEFFAELTAAYCLEKINKYDYAKRSKMEKAYGGLESTIKSALDDASNAIYWNKY